MKSKRWQKWSEAQSQLHAPPQRRNVRCINRGEVHHAASDLAYHQTINIVQLLCCRLCWLYRPWQHPKPKVNFRGAWQRRCCCCCSPAAAATSRSGERREGRRLLQSRYSYVSQDLTLIPSIFFQCPVSLRQSFVSACQTNVKYAYSCLTVFRLLQLWQPQPVWLPLQPRLLLPLQRRPLQVLAVCQCMIWSSISALAEAHSHLMTSASFLSLLAMSS